MSQELEYEYKLMKKILKQEYPWIIDIAKCETSDSYTYVKPIDIIVNADQLVELTNCELESWASNLIEKDGQYESLYLQVAVKDDCKEEMVDINRNIERIMNSVHMNDAIPPSLKSKQSPSIHFYILTK